MVSKHDRHLVLPFLWPFCSSLCTHSVPTGCLPLPAPEMAQEPNFLRLSLGIALWLCPSFSLPPHTHTHTSSSILVRAWFSQWSLSSIPLPTPLLSVLLLHVIYIILCFEHNIMYVNRCYVSKCKLLYVDKIPFIVFFLCGTYHNCN